MEADHQDDDIMIMEEMKSHMRGKRTKRLRPSSVLTLTIASTTSSSSNTTTSGAPANPSGFFPMPTTSPSTTSVDFMTNINDDDEDMANCLMLLAHSHHVPSPPTSNMVVQPPSYVFECKTCDRGFTSFQALGGHRASHNKPHKDVHELSKNRPSVLISPNKFLSCNPSGSAKGPKVHECSICGSEFTSGQALGGHMRRHRSMSMATATTTTTTSCNKSLRDPESKKHKTLLPLDLNLPAPIEDDHKESKFPFGSNNQIIVFSKTPSLVDCHF